MSHRVIVALSGGVDSAVAALLLKRAGHALEALHMTNWEEDEAGYCSAAEDWQDARRVAGELGIPIHRVSFAAEYRDRVFRHFLADYAAGLTPNPDILCNREVKFGVCLDYLRRLGGTMLATGHYARIEVRDGRPRLCRALDADKDQSYFLQQMPTAALEATCFPIGGMKKADVRELARTAGLPVHDRPDSTGICFIGERPFRQFLASYLEARPGPIETPDGEVLGTHEGLHHHTIGQRQGLRIGGRAHQSGAPWYVARKDVGRNTLIVVQGQDHPLLAASGFRTGPVAWLGTPPNRGISVQVRHRQSPAACELKWTDDGADIRLVTPLRGVAPGQHAAFYADDECLGGAVIVANETSGEAVLNHAVA